MLKSRQLALSFHAELYNLVPQDHLLRRIAAVVDFSFVNELLADSYCRYYGRPAQEPELMMRLLFLQYLYNLSDEQVMQDAQVNLAYKWFLGLNPEDPLPDPSVLSRFRTQRVARSEQNVKGLLAAVVRQCVEKGLVTSTRVLVDATHMEADTQSKRPLDLLRAAATKIVRAMRKHHPDLVGQLPPVPHTHDMPASEAGEALLQYLEQLTEKARKVVPTMKGPLADAVRRSEAILGDERRLQANGISSAEDLDARLGRKSRTFLFFGYKQHVSMTDGDEIITACHVTPGNADDGRQLPTLLQDNKATIPDVTELVGDAAYGSRANLAALNEAQVTGYVIVRPAVFNNQPDPHFTYNKDSDQWICPTGQASYRRRRFEQRRGGVTSTGYMYFFDPRDCKNCPLRQDCFSGNRQSRVITVTDTDAVRDAARQRQSDRAAKAIYQRRKAIEHKFAELKRFCGQARARYRSLSRVLLQAIMGCVVANAKRMAKLAAPCRG